MPCLATVRQCLPKLGELAVLRIKLEIRNLPAQTNQKKTYWFVTKIVWATRLNWHVDSAGQAKVDLRGYPRVPRKNVRGSLSTSNSDATATYRSSVSWSFLVFLSVHAYIYARKNSNHLFITFAWKQDWTSGVIRDFLRIWCLVRQWAWHWYLSAFYVWALKNTTVWIYESTTQIKLW